MKRVFLWGSTGLAAVVTALGLSSAANADTGSNVPQVTGPQAPGPVRRAR
jgi:hypothetical protein